MLLNGTWSLYPIPPEVCADTPEALAATGITPIPATVPGNVELALSVAGILPADLYFGMNIREAERYETWSWWYEITFTAPVLAPDETALLHFGGVDCFADYFLDGEWLDRTSNMLIPHDIDITARLRPGASHTLQIHIGSPIVEGMTGPNELSMSLYNWHKPIIAAHVRKAPHSYGWDIMPRALSAGIWRAVELRVLPPCRFEFLHVHLAHHDGHTGRIRFVYDSTVPAEYAFKNLDFTLTGVCGDHTFARRFTCLGKAGVHEFSVDGLRRWWPRPYGEADLYTITVEASCDGKPLMRETIRRGFRTLELRRDDVLVEGKGRFEFVINGTCIMAVGSNWVPMDAYHSRDAARYAKALDLAVEAGCNILRCWGGNVYEDQAFFDFCDTHGIMVWQDFAMACAAYPQTAEFAEAIRHEAETVVLALRDHPSLVLWCGDNEVDQMTVSRGGDPEQNHITRSVLPRVIERLDPARPYIPSSPYISPAARRAGPASYPEDHLWGPRDYFKSKFYTSSRAAFVSETGYHGCPSISSIKGFISPEKVWPYQQNAEWNLHSTDQSNSDSRVMLMHRQVAQLFGDVPTEPEDYVLASQISQAEAKKFFIERVRAQMGRMGGVIWWNLIDGWPQMSDAVVGYDYEKKLAFDYIRRSSAPFLVLVGEMGDWGHPILCANSTLARVRGHVTITDLATGDTLFAADFDAAPNANTSLGRMNLYYSHRSMLLIRWESDRGAGLNTYLTGSPAYSLDAYKKWLAQIAQAEAEL